MSFLYALVQDEYLKSLRENAKNDKILKNVLNVYIIEITELNKTEYSMQKECVAQYLI